MNVQPNYLSGNVIQHFKNNLEARREEALEFLRKVVEERENLHRDGPQDLADLCVFTSSREYLFQRSSQQRQLLQKIERALQRIQDGVFGTCENCGDLINRKRLEVMPWAQHCLPCQEEMERCVRAQTLAAYAVDSGRP